VGLVATRYGPRRCRGAKEALGVIWLLCSDTLHVRLCRLGLASVPLEAMGKLCLLMSRPVRDLVRKVADNVVPKGQRRGVLEPR
jgi:hypothetical protein